MSKKLADQDGPDFYDTITCEHIASYPSFVAGDYDLEGAMKARAHFLELNPDYEINQKPF